jgi:hypothetical protein
MEKLCNVCSKYHEDEPNYDQWDDEEYLDKEPKDVPMERYWICNVEGTFGYAPFKHWTLEAAMDEAERLARLPNNIGKKVLLYGFAGECKVNEMPVTWEVPHK